MMGKISDIDKTDSKGVTPFIATITQANTHVAKVIKLYF